MHRLQINPVIACDYTENLTLLPHKLLLRLSKGHDAGIESAGMAARFVSAYLYSPRWLPGQGLDVTEISTAGMQQSLPLIHLA